MSLMGAVHLSMSRLPRRGLLLLAALMGVMAAGCACAQDFATHTFHVYVIEMNALARQRAAVQAYVADGWRRWGAAPGVAAQDGVIILLNGAGSTVPLTLELDHDRGDQAERIASYLSRQLLRAGAPNSQYPGLDLGEAQAEAAKAVDRQIDRVDRESKRKGTFSAGKLTVVVHIVADEVYFRRPSESRQSLGDFAFADACFVPPADSAAIAERLQRFRLGPAQRQMALVLVQPGDHLLAPAVERAVALTLGGPDPTAAGMVVYRDGAGCIEAGDPISIPPASRTGLCGPGTIAGGERPVRDSRTCLPIGSAEAPSKLQARLTQVFGPSAANATLALALPPAKPPETAPPAPPVQPPKAPPPAPIAQPKPRPPAPAQLPPAPAQPPKQAPPPVPPVRQPQVVPPSASLDPPSASTSVAKDGTVWVSAQRKPVASSSQFVIEGRLAASAAALTIIAKPLEGSAGDLVVSQKVSDRPTRGDYALVVRVPRGYPCRENDRLFFTFKLDGLRVDPESQGIYAVEVGGACEGPGIDVPFGRMKIK